jgi:hypothetical protein
VLTIETDDARVRRYLAGAYRAVAGAPSDRVPHDRGAILVSGNEAVARFEDELLLRGEPAADPIPFAVAAAGMLFRASFQHDAEHVAWYAAGLAIDGSAVLISGPSGVGKTTLALELIGRGHGLYGDEYVFLRRRDRRLVAFPRALMLREGATVRHDVDVERVFGRRVFAASARLRAAYLLERGPQSAVAPLAPAVFALSVAPRVGGRGNGLQRLDALLALLAGVHCYRLTMADPASAARALLASLPC